MVVEAVQTYVNLVTGVSRATRERARAAARGLLAQVGLEEVADDAEKRVAKLTEEILDASRANRELLEKLVASEAASRLGFVRSDELDEVREEIAELRAQLARDKAASSDEPATARPPAAGEPAATSTETPKAPGAGRATSTRPGAAQRLAEQTRTGSTDTDPGAEAGA